MKKIIFVLFVLSIAIVLIGTARKSHLRHESPRTAITPHPPIPATPTPATPAPSAVSAVRQVSAVHQSDITDFRTRIEELNRTGCDDIDLINEWARRSPWDAWKYILAAKSGKAFARVFEGVFIEMTRMDAARAAQELARIDDPDVLDNGYLSLTHYWAQQDILSALEWAESLPPGRRSTQTRQNLLLQLAEQHPEVVASTDLKTLPESPFRQDLASAVAFKLAQQDRAAALKWVTSLESKEEYSRAFKAMLSAVTLDSPEDALLIAQIAPSADTARFIRDLVGDELNRSLREDPNPKAQQSRLQAWANSLHQEEQKDAIWIAAAGALKQNSPVDALQSALHITNLETRKNTLAEITLILKECAPDKLDALLSDRTVDDQTRKFLLSVATPTSE